MKFDYIIGNPPYQEETDNTSDKPIYDRFMDETFKIGDTVELITPARFLYNVGKTPKNWNHKILNDTHFKPLKVYRKSYEVFPNTDIKGGVVISLRDKKKVFGPLVSFSSVEEMQPILSKILDNDISFTPITDIIYPQNKFNLIALYEWNPKFSEMVGSGGNEKRLTTSIFTTLPEVFDDTSGADKVSILGLIQNKRIKKFINRKFLKEGEELDSYKVFVSEANGNGTSVKSYQTRLLDHQEKE